MANRANGTHELVEDCIYTALLQLMREKDYKEITITDITRKAGVSRMAYYRNYRDKDEILTKRLAKSFLDFVYQLEADLHMPESKFWEAFFYHFRNDTVFENIFKAGLTDHIFRLHRDVIVDVYGRLFHWDMTVERNIIAVYQRMGCIEGLLYYLFERGADADLHLIVRQMMTITVGDAAKVQKTE